MVHLQEDLLQSQTEGLGAGDPQQLACTHVLQEAPHRHALDAPRGILGYQVLQWLPIPLLAHCRGDLLEEILHLKRVRTLGVCLQKRSLNALLDRSRQYFISIFLQHISLQRKAALLIVQKKVIFGSVDRKPSALWRKQGKEDAH